MCLTNGRYTVTRMKEGERAIKRVSRGGGALLGRLREIRSRSALPRTERHASIQQLREPGVSGSGWYPPHPPSTPCPRVLYQYSHLAPGNQLSSPAGELPSRTRTQTPDATACSHCPAAPPLSHQSGGVSPKGHLTYSRASLECVLLLH